MILTDRQDSPYNQYLCELSNHFYGEDAIVKVYACMQLEAINDSHTRVHLNF